MITAILLLESLGFEAFEQQAESNCPIYKNAVYLMENNPQKLSCLWSNDYKALVNMCLFSNTPIPTIIDRFHAAALLKSLMRGKGIDKKLII